MVKILSYNSFIASSAGVFQLPKRAPQTKVMVLGGSAREACKLQHLFLIFYYIITTKERVT
jgi:hypothetical protein